MDANLAAKVNAKAQKVPLFMWDTYEINKAEVDYLMSELDMDEDKAWDHVYGDCELLTLAWSDLCQWVEEWMKTNDFHHFYAEGSKMTWRNFDGHKAFVADSGDDFIRKVIGFDCDCTLYLYERGKPGDVGYHLYGSVSHHDSPTGEGRYVYPVEGCGGCGKPIMDGTKTVDMGRHGTYCADCGYEGFVYEVEDRWGDMIGWLMTATNATYDCILEYLYAADFDYEKDDICDFALNESPITPEDYKQAKRWMEEDN